MAEMEKSASLFSIATNGDDPTSLIEWGSDERTWELVSVPKAPQSPTSPSVLSTTQRMQPTCQTRAIPKPLAQPASCPMCKGAGYLRQEVPLGHPSFGKPKMCQCKIKKQSETLLGGAHIPDDFGHCSFESYLHLSLTPEQRQVAMLMQSFLLPRLGAYQGRKRGLYLHGLWGVGKTGLAVSALRLALSAGKSGLYLQTSDLFECLYEAVAASQRLMRGYGEQKDRQEESAGSKLLRLVERVEWLVLDDLGVECSSRFVIGRLYRILEGRRACSGLYTIFTSNKDARGLECHWREDRSRSSVFDDGMRVIERLGEYCVPIHVTGRNLRERVSPQASA